MKKLLLVILFSLLACFGTESLAFGQAGGIRVDRTTIPPTWHFPGIIHTTDLKTSGILNVGNGGIASWQAVIKDDTNYPLKLQGGTAGGAVLMGFYSDVQGYRIGFNASEEFYISDATASTTPFYIESTAPTDAFRIGSSGNIGIGTSSTSFDLTIQKTKASPVTLRVYNDDSTDGSSRVIVGSSGGGIVSLLSNTSTATISGIPAGFSGIVSDYGDMVFAVGTGGSASEGMRLTDSGNLTITGTVDGRDVATDGTKLDSVESSATADQTGAEIKTAYEAEANAYTDTKDTKLSGIATGAEVNTNEDFYPAGAAVLSTNASFQTDHVTLPDAVTIAVSWFTMRLPSDFSSMASGYPKVVFAQGTGGTGNYRISFSAFATAVGEQIPGASDSITEFTRAAPGASAEIWEEDVSAAFNGLGLSANDNLSLTINRDSDDSLDTFAGDLDVLGVVVKYD